MKHFGILSPVLVGILTVATLYSANVSRINYSEIFIPLLISLVFSIFFSFIFWLNPLTHKHWQFIASVFTLSAIMFYEFTPIVSGIIMVASCLVCISIKLETKTASSAIAFISIIGILASTGQAVFINATRDVQVELVGISPTDKELPNIYFIVPDRMPSIDAMKESGIDSTKFVSDMSRMGFYIKDNQLSHDTYTYNYDGPTLETTRTMRFFASVLNNGMDISLESKYNPVRTLIIQPELFNQLHARGYTIINIASWFSETKDVRADITYKYTDITPLERIFDNELSVEFRRRSIISGISFRFMQSDDSIGKVERGRSTWQANLLKNTTGHSQFIMCHILMPHQPFVYNANGNPANSKLSVPEQYKAQIEYSLTYLEEIATQVTISDPGAIIIIQSDEGICYPKPIELNYGLSNTQWNGVLTAWKIPGFDNRELEKLRHTEVLKMVLD